MTPCKNERTPIMNETSSARQERTRLLVGDSGIEILRNARVLVLGVGGVGAYAAEHLARAGIGRLTLVDGDTVEPSNCNRQLPALSSTLGRPKAEVMAERLREVNPELNVDVRVEFIAPEDVGALLDTGFDYAVDAIDSLAAKVAFLLECRRRKQPLISSMGAGGKTDPELIRIADISKSYGCALARAVRARLKEHGVERGVKVVFSPEEVSKSAIRTVVNPDGSKRAYVGTISYMPAAFGGFCASAVLRGLLKPR